jgi:hypothetical protein
MSKPGLRRSSKVLEVGGVLTTPNDRRVSCGSNETTQAGAKKDKMSGASLA